jgi:hypothetical protein
VQLMSEGPSRNSTPFSSTGASLRPAHALRAQL